MSFYRIYRPQVIDEIDNVSVRDALLRLLEKPKKDLPHAFLFSGPRGAGKTTAARIIAKLFNCQKPTKSGPCGLCEACVSISEGRDLDILEIDAASNRGIDEMRTLRDGINLTPSSGAYKIYIIDEVHMLTTEAFNALLKTLEEPPAHAVFVLATTDSQKVPVTIKSRCVSFVFSKASTEELTNALKRIVVKEKIQIDDEALTIIASSVDGAFRDAVKYLEQVSFHKGKINAEVVRSILALSEEKIKELFLTSLRAKKTTESLVVIQQLAKEGKDIKMFVVDCLSSLEKTLIAQVRGSSPGGWTREDLTQIIHKLSQAYTEIKGAPISELPLELAVVEYCDMEKRQTGTVSKNEGVTDSVSFKTFGSTVGIAPTIEKSVRVAVQPAGEESTGLLTLEKLTDHWGDVIAELKPFNHSVAGVMRSTRPKSVAGGIVTIEAFYTFHKDKLSEVKTREVIGNVLNKLFGEKVKVDVVLGKK
ncbi:MAG TPA: DNA polymerase III subunit gamma/tau [Patescibacteria group bacterium]|nr:DNA polymerase III subunit gamma/tau [Patescibacteria group bacterium]